MKRLLFVFALFVSLAIGAHIESGRGDALLAITPAIVALRKKKAKLADEARALLDREENEDEEFTEDDETRYNEIMAEIDQINGRIQRQERMQQVDETLEARSPVQTVEDEENPGGTDRVTMNEEDRRHYLAFHTLRLMQGNAMGNARIQDDAAQMLVRGGHYGDDAAQLLNQGMRADQVIATAFRRRHERLLRSVYGEEYRAAGDYYSTLVNADGAYLLPTVVVMEIEEIAEQVGVILGLTNPYNHIVGTLRVPGGSGADSKMSFVAEGGEITSRIRSFQAVELNPGKVADIIPWTLEVSVEAGPQILADIERVMGRAYGKAVDDAAINGNGTASYNSIDGILSTNRSPGELVLASGEVDFDDITPDELILGINEVPAGVRSNFTYVFHPDMQAVFKTKKDTNGAYLFDWTMRSDGIMLVAGVPTRFSEVLPGLADTAISTSFGVGGDWRYLKVALGSGIQTEEMRTGTVKDADTGADINLGTQDLRALKYRAFFDIDANFDSAFMKFTTAAS